MGSTRTLVVIFIIIVVGVFGVRRWKSHAPDESVKPKAEPTMVVSGSSIIGQLDRFSGRLTYKKKGERMWKDTEPNARFFDSDYVLTQENTVATIKLRDATESEKATEFELGETTLVFFNTSFFSTASGGKADGSFLSTGDVRVKTFREYMVLTPGALVRLRGTSFGEEAQAMMSLRKIEKGFRLIISTKRGLATVVDRNGRATMMEPESLKQLSIVEPQEDFERHINETPWVIKAIQLPFIEPTPAPTPPPATPTPPPVPTAGPAPSVKIKPTPKPKPKKVEPPKPKLADMPAQKIAVRVVFPPDRAEVYEPQAALKGKVTGLGAKVLVNGVEADIRADFSFSVPLSLKMGPNPIIIQTIQPDGTSSFTNWTIIRKP